MNKALYELRERVCTQYSSMTTQELALAIIALRLDDIGMQSDFLNGLDDPYGRDEDFETNIVSFSKGKNHV